MTTTTNAEGLYRKLAEVVCEVDEVAKTGVNKFHGYKYATAEAILAALRKPLASRGVVLLPSIGDITERAYKTSKGSESTITTVRVDFTFVDGETGHMHQCSWAGQGDDPADKGLGKAYTSAVKTFLRESFLLPQSDDPEGDSDTDRRAGDRQRSRPRSSNGEGVPAAGPAAAASTTVRAGTGGVVPAPKQVEYLKRLLTGQAGYVRPTRKQLTVMLTKLGLSGPEPGWVQALTADQCDQLIWTLTRQPASSVEHPTDAPADPDLFQHEAAGS